MAKKSTAPIPLRRIAREWSFQYLYQADISGGETDEIDWFWDQCIENCTHKLGNREIKKIRRLADRFIEGVTEHMVEIDEIITEFATNWTIERMAVVDRNILRLGTYEIKYCDDIPPQVTINEAIEIVKGFGSEDSKSFINGILDKVFTTYGSA
ncbi:MAG: transcription antitermination factor NusB [Lentisphaeria bacterium]|nr:transcription antitermination factor NusB [Lentisphaeria bacterium]NQZ68104.1 transcription antitermination factor NusB [Lentisphaeria bacterium]